MANKQGEFQLKVASDKPNKFNLDKKVVASHDFGTLTPIECKLMLPGDKFDVNVNQFTYLMPMPKPTFGKIDTINRAFFVPFRVLFKDWKEFISNQKVAHVNPAEQGSTLSYVPVSPQTTVREFTSALLSLMSEGSEPTAGQLGRIYDSVDNYDFVYNYIHDDGVLTKKYVVLTFMGRKLFTVLHGLGYNLPLIRYTGSTDADESAFELASKKISLLPLLAFARAYFDWIIPSRFISAHRNLQCAISDIFAGYTNVNSTGSYNDGTGFVHAPLLIGLLKLYSSYLADDYFTSAFMTTFGYEDTVNVGYSTSLNNPNSGINSDFDGVSSRVDGISDNGAGASTNSPYQYIQQFTLKSLGALQDMINRGKVAGSKIQDYLRVTYGIRPSAEALDLSVYLGSNRSTIQIGSVMSNADTEAQGGATLGQYAGRGIGDNQGHFSYEAKEHGIFIITNELQVKSSYWQGLRPECTLIDREDFYQPEFDNVGVDAIDQMQLASVDLVGSDAESLFGGEGIEFPFGFTPRYSKLKVNFDSLLGDFRFKTKNTGLDSWYLARYFELSKDYEIDENFSLMTQRNTSTQYDHIFQVADNSADHFYSVFNLDFTAYRHMKTISEALDTEEGSDRIDVDFNGGVD